MTEPAAQAVPSVRTGPNWFNLIGLSLLALVAIDVIGLFLSGIFHWAALLRLSLAIFVYLQMGLTAASLGAFPVTLVAVIRRSMRRGTR